MQSARHRRVLQALHKAQGGRCCYCGRGVVMPGPHGWKQGHQHRDNAATMEHLQRKADGGTDRLDNLALACKSCNSRRGAMSWVEFKTIMAAATSVRPAVSINRNTHGN